jgi:hypothetical protein
VLLPKHYDGCLHPWLSKICVGVSSEGLPRSRWGLAAQMRIVSAGAFWPNRRGLLRFLKYIVRARIPEFESDMSNQAVQSPQRKCEVWTAADSARRIRVSAAEPERLLGDNRCSSPTIRGAAGSIGMKVAGTSPADGLHPPVRAVVELRRAPALPGGQPFHK